MTQATITLYFDPQTYERESGEPLSADTLRDFAEEVNDVATHFCGYEAWGTEMPTEEVSNGT
jgi:hypothetical protein